MAGNEDVPHLSLLGVRKDALRIHYAGVLGRENKHFKVSSKGKSCSARIEGMPCGARNKAFEEISWPHAWGEYVRGNVVSDAAAALIKSFLLKTLVGSGDQQNAEDSEADRSENEQDVPLQLCAAAARAP